jgi:hypothetical protein
LRELPIRHRFPGNSDDPDQQPDELDQRKWGSLVLDQNQKREGEGRHGQRLQLENTQTS